MDLLAQDPNPDRADFLTSELWELTGPDRLQNRLRVIVVPAQDQPWIAIVVTCERASDRGPHLGVLVCSKIAVGVEHLGELPAPILVDEVAGVEQAGWSDQRAVIVCQWASDGRR